MMHMTNGDEITGATDHGERAPYRVSLPGFITDKDIGLGDVIKRAASYIGVRPCGGCNERAVALNRRLIFSPRSK